MFFVETDRVNDEVELGRQGQVIGYADPGHVVAVIHEWGFGNYVYSTVIPVREMCGWYLFRTEEENKAAHESGVIANVFARLERIEARKAAK